MDRDSAGPRTDGPVGGTKAHRGAVASQGEGPERGRRRYPWSVAERIVILGGGFGGAWCARALERKIPDADVLVLDRNNYFVFYPLLVEAGTGAIEPRHAVVRQRSLLRRTRFHMGEVVGLDTGRREVQYRLGGDGRLRTATYDHLVVALGSVTRLPPVPGLAEHGWEIKSIADAIALQDRAIRMLELAAATDDAARRRALLHFVIVGGSFTGAELAGEYQAFLRSVARRYPQLDPRQCHVTLVERLDRILPALAPSLSEYATRVMRRRGIDVRLGRSVDRIETDRVHLDDGKVLDASTAVWCAGVAPNPVVRSLGLPLTEGGWIRCREDLRVEGLENVWAIGDAAENPGPTGRPYPATAQHAIREAAHVATNLAEVLAGRPTTPCRIENAGTLAPLGCRTAVAEVFGLKVSGFLAWWLFRTVYLMKMPGVVRKARVLADWNLNLVLPREPVQLGIAPTWARRPPETFAGGDRPS